MVAVRGVLILAAFGCWAQSVAAQGPIEINQERGPSGTHFDLPVNTDSFIYEATVTTSPAQSFTLKFKVYHNGVQKHSHTATIINPPADYLYNRTVAMSTWGLLVGDCVTFHLKVNLVCDSSIWTQHYLYGDVVNAASFDREPSPAGDAWLVYLDRRSRFETLMSEALS